MSNIDRQRVAAVRKLEALGYRYEGDERLAPTVTSKRVEFRFIPPADKILLRTVFDTQSYGAVRWTVGKVPGGKG